MSEDFEKEPSPNELRASRKAEQRQKQQERAKVAPVVARYGIWSGDGYLREGEGLERLLALQSMPSTERKRREKRRKHKKK
ncbi:MAG: hypothetical protein HXX20_25075 [Chloroflexi bacterium]|nr:hypothetical protein [Chloroflexota bacterium]